MKYKSKINKIASSYHDRDVLSSYIGPERECPCCERIITTTISIEHDSCNYSKDLNICHDCYRDIYKWWEDNKPKKICPY